MKKELTSQERKERPVFTGVLKYFPKAIMEISRVSLAGNKQHNNGDTLHWDKTKSIGTGDEIVRHLMDAGTLDTDGIPHTAKMAWRALEFLERELDGR